MLNPEPEQAAVKPKKPPVKRPPPKPVNRGPTPPSEALTKLRAVTDAAEGTEHPGVDRELGKRSVVRVELAEGGDARAGHSESGQDQVYEGDCKAAS